MNTLFQKSKTILAFIFTLLLFQNSFSQFNWSPAGPIFSAGRARNLIVDKTDPTGNTLYIGSSTSGIFITTDGGVSWRPLDDQGNVRNISYLAQDKDGVIWAATGEGFLSYSQKLKTQKGRGLYKLVNNSLQRVQDSLAVGLVINKLACSPVDAKVFALASNKGILISKDGAVNFLQAAGIPSTIDVSYGLDVKFDGNGILYCSIGNERGGYYYGTSGASYSVVGSKVYKSTDATLSNFKNITPYSPVLSDSLYGRIELGLNSSGNAIYASCARKNISNTTGAPSVNSASLSGLFVSYDAGNTWALILQGSPQSDPLSNGGSSSCGDYAQSLLADPTGSFLLYGGYKLFGYTRTGGPNSAPTGSFTQIGTNFPFVPQYYLHEKIHDIKYIPGIPEKYYFVTDAGVYRCIDFNNYKINYPPSFQPFYAGLVTGQFNSVAIERFPFSANTVTGSSAGSAIYPYYGFTGGTSGNGITYYSGTSNTANTETNYLGGGEIFACDYSKILDNVAFFTSVNGNVYRSSNITNSSPISVLYNAYSGGLTTSAPTAKTFFNNNYNSSGTPYKLWENYGQVSNTPDYAYFFNDSLRLKYSMIGVSSLTTSTTFTFAAQRPNRSAIIDSIAIRTGTVVLDDGSKSPTWDQTDKQDMWIKFKGSPLSFTFNTHKGRDSVHTITVFTGSNVSIYGANAKSTIDTLDATSLNDRISVTFNAPPFLSKTTASSTTVSDFAAFYRVFATVFYKYKSGDTVKVIDNNIATKTFTYSTVLSQPLQWSKIFSVTNTLSAGPKNNINPVAVLNPTSNPLIKIQTKMSARIAFALSNNDINGATSPPSIVVSKSPLNLNDPMNFVRVSESGCLSDDAIGNPSTNTISITGYPTIIEWSKNGRELYYSTDDYKVYRVSHITDILDMSPSSYSGKFLTDIYAYTSPASTTSLNLNSPYRTTLIGVFDKPITSLSMSNDDKSLLVTFNNPSPTSTNALVAYANRVDKFDYTYLKWMKKEGAMNGVQIYCSLTEKDDQNRILIGTDNGVYFCEDISSPNPGWRRVNNNQLPYVQIFDLKQQTRGSHDCFNSGQIYAATNGRGIWATSAFYKPFYVGVNEHQNYFYDPEKNLNIFPNPSNGIVNTMFVGYEGEDASLNIMDLSGRTVKSEYIGKLSSGEVSYTFDTGNLSPGVYLVSISGSSSLKRTGKLVVTK